MKLRWTRVYILLVYLTTCYGQLCQNGVPFTFAKVASMIPRTFTQPVLLYATSRGTAITAECYNRCQSSDDCSGFIVDYERASCFRVPNSENSNELLPAKYSSYFMKVCLQVPTNCTKRAWPIEFTPNAELVGYQQQVIPNINDRWQCAQLCLTGTSQYRYGQAIPCYSAQYVHWSKTCIISGENRHTKPEAFGPSLQEGIDYIENECIAETSGGNPGCWHEPVNGYALTTVDLQIPNITLDQCRERCATEEYFTCRGFTLKCPLGSNNTICYLYSDDTLSAGPPMPSACATYVERLNCIDLKVECSSMNMVLTLNYKGFSGRMFSVGHSEECGISGHNQDITTFVLPIPVTPRDLNRCGVFIALSVGYGNRKMANAVVAVQRHPIIQTLGDRVVKVSCIAEDNTDRLPRPLFNNITLDASFGVAEPPVQTAISNEISNISSTSPTARLRILDISRGGSEASETMLGEELELRVDIYPPFNVSVLRAGHLVASSGDGRESLLLLDWRGCPPDPSTFPALVPKGQQTLFAIFKAFRFPSSPILRFSLILTICEVICQPTDCGNGLNSWGKRRKRSAEYNQTTQEVPLQLSIIVRTPDQEYSDTNDTASLRTEPTYDDTICMNWSAALTIVLLFGVLQIILLATCCYVLYYRKQKKPSDQISLNNDFQPRHVSWSDQ